MTTGELIAIGISVLSAGMSAWALRYSYQSAQAALRQADAAEAMVPPPPPKVAWRVETSNAWTYVLRNVGTEAARNVKVVAPGWDPGLVNVQPCPVVRPDGSFAVSVKSVAEVPDLVEFHVTWDGQVEPVAVPIPG